MEKVSLKAYAVKHKLSLFNVVKMTKSGQIPTEIVKENGRDVVYILIDEAIEDEITKGIVRVKKQEPYGLKKENERLKKEIIKLQAEITQLKNRV